MNLLLSVAHVSVITLYLLLCDWLISASTASPRFIPVVVCVRMAFLFKAEFHGMYRPLFVYPFVCEWILDYLYILAAVNMSEHIPLQDSAFNSLGIYPDVHFVDHMIILYLII